ncbi:MAG: protein translocase subunit SecF [Desulfovibrionaceae bacterium]|nr:protein translocase subunit SecF [Desulfovibrionaceae bacterium]MBF0514624.1 protein translocase subunit SecF [Desulfovibrionaceae bacterium]
MGFELIKHTTNINFLKYRRLAYAASLLVILVGVGSLIVHGGPLYGVDFAGGVSIQVKFNERIDPQRITQALEPVALPGLSVQRFGQERDASYLIRASLPETAQDTIRSQVGKALTDGLNIPFEIQRLETVGPKVGEDLRSAALHAAFVAILLIAIYISGRFEQRWMAAGAMAAGLGGSIWLLNQFGVNVGGMILAALLVTLVLCFVLKLKFALGAVVADIHDVAITIGVFSLLGKEFDLTIVAALLTILGYSLNDTIIVYDRIRENLRDPAHKDASFEKIINDAVNQTLSRTILTAGTALISVLALYVFGGGALHEFALAMIIGIVVGTYSSVFVASPILLDFGKGLDQPKPEIPAKPAATVKVSKKKLKVRIA